MSERVEVKLTKEILIKLNFEGETIGSNVRSHLKRNRTSGKFKLQVDRSRKKLKKLFTADT